MDFSPSLHHVSTLLSAAGQISVDGAGAHVCDITLKLNMGHFLPFLFIFVTCAPGGRKTTVTADLFHSCCHQQTRCQWPNRLYKYHCKVLYGKIGQVCQRGYLLASNSSRAAIATVLHERYQCNIAETKKVSWHPILDELWDFFSSTSHVIFSTNSSQHLQKISCSMLSFHCSVSDVQGETDGKPNAVIPFARARHKAVRQLGPHVTTRAISNVACL